MRIKEATHIREIQLQGEILTIQSKGGKEITKKLTNEDSKALRESFQDGKFEINSRTFSRDLKEAVELVGNTWNGTHGMRHSYAQQKLEQGWSKSEVSKEMGHTREEITDIYLR